MKRGFWFVTGAGLGVYAAARARRAVESLTADGLSDRWAGLTHGARVFADEVRAGMAERDAQLREQIELSSTTPLGLTGGSATAPSDEATPLEPGQPHQVNLHRIEEQY